MAKFGKEWVASGGLTPQEAEDHVRSITERDEGRVTDVVTVDSDSDRHWMIDCLNPDPHLHVYVKWERPDELA